MSEITRQHLELVTWKNDRWPRPQIQQDNILIYIFFGKTPQEKTDIITNKNCMNAFWEKKSKNWDVQFEEIILRSFEWFLCVVTQILEEEKWSCRFLALMGHLLFFSKITLLTKSKPARWRQVSLKWTKYPGVKTCHHSGFWLFNQPGVEYQEKNTNLHKSTTFTCQLRFFVGVSSNQNRW